MGDLIFPNALVVAAKTFAKKPELVGRVMVELVAADRAGSVKFTEVERYIIAECREEIAERDARREQARDRKRTQRSKGGV